MEVYVRATVWYTCELNDDQAKQVFEYMFKNHCSAEYAVEMLYNQGNFGLYDNSVESDFSTEEIEDVNLDNCWWDEEEEEEEEEN